MNELEILVIKQLCTDLVIRAARTIDNQEYQALTSLFSLEGLLVRPGSEPLKGREAIYESYKNRPQSRITRHLITQTLVDVESTDCARGLSCVLLWSGSSADAMTTYGRPANNREVLGEFEDEFVRVDGQWHIARRVSSFVLYRDN